MRATRVRAIKHQRLDGEHAHSLHQLSLLLLFFDCFWAGIDQMSQRIPGPDYVALYVLGQFSDTDLNKQMI